MENKMTYVSALNSAIACKTLSIEVREKLTALRDAQEKRTHATRKPTANQTANESFKDEILEYLGSVERATISDIMKNVPALAELSNQRVSAVVRQMVLAGTVEREEEKRKAYFRLASDSEVVGE